MTGIEPGWRAPPELRDRQTFHDDPGGELRRYLASTDAESSEATQAIASDDKR